MKQKAFKMMVVVSTSNLVSSEIKKIAAACNFQTMTINSFAMPHDLMTDQTGSSAYMKK